MVGMPAVDTVAEYDPGTLAAWGQKIVGTKMGSAKLSQDIPELIEHYRAGRLKLDPLISGRFSLEEVNEALAQVRDGSAIKNVITFD